MHARPNFRAIDSDLDQASLYVSTGCGFLTPTREDFPTPVGST